MADGLHIITAGLSDNIELIVIAALIILFDVVLPLLKKKRKQNQTGESLPDDDSVVLEDDVDYEVVYEDEPEEAPTAKRRPSPDDFTLGGRSRQRPGQPQRPTPQRPQPAPEPAQQEADPLEVLRRYERMRQERRKRERAATRSRTSQPDSGIGRELRKQFYPLMRPLAGYEEWAKLLQQGNVRAQFLQGMGSPDFPWRLPLGLQALAREAMETIPRVTTEIHDVTGIQQGIAEFESLEDLQKHPGRLVTAMLPYLFADALGFALVGPTWGRIRVLDLVRRGKLTKLDVPVNAQQGEYLEPPLSSYARGLINATHSMGYMQQSDETSYLIQKHLSLNDNTRIRLTGLPQHVEFEVESSELASTISGAIRGMIRARYESLLSQSLRDFARRHDIFDFAKDAVRRGRDLEKLGISSTPGPKDLVALVDWMALNNVQSLSEALERIPVGSEAAAVDSISMGQLSAAAVTEGVILREVLLRPGGNGRL